jgi:hypothetical protein
MDLLHIAITARHGGAGDREDDIKIIAERILDQNPKASEKRLAAILAERLRESDDLITSAAVLIVHSAVEARHKLDSRLERKSTKSPEIKAAAKEQTKRIVDQTVKRIVLMSIIMPHTGKTLSASTGAEVAQAGHLWRRVAARVRPDELVGNVLTEKDLVELL